MVIPPGKSARLGFYSKFFKAEADKCLAGGMSSCLKDCATIPPEQVRPGDHDAKKGRFRIQNRVNRQETWTARRRTITNR